MNYPSQTDFEWSNFEWGLAKSDKCLTQRGFDFAYAINALLDPFRVIYPDDRFVYGEDRFRLIGKIGHRMFVVVFTPPQGAIRIISARKANRREQALYDHRPQDN